MTIRSTLILTAAVAGLLAACGPAASNDAPATPAPVAPAAAEPTSTDSSSAVQAQTTAAPSPTEGYDWDSRLNDEGRSRSMVLAYEVPNTDDQPLNLSCEEGGRRIFAGTQTANVDLGSISLASTNGSRSHPVKEAVADELGGGEYVTVQLAGDDPTLVAFRESGWMRLTVDGRTTDMAAQPASDARRKIAAFMAFCNAS
ncbi:MAG: hypothetical protein DCF29_14610 [Alphaproteobacteria bacterium]|nr:MAG: hypothetical protein DCF29_14610 [Alphaproteobacteria bacterium]